LFDPKRSTQEAADPPLGSKGKTKTEALSNIRGLGYVSLAKTTLGSLSVSVVFSFGSVEPVSFDSSAAF
jgi:hypothetical protein